MKTYTEDQVRRKVEKYVKKFPTAVAAAQDAGCTRSELSIAMNGGRVPAKLLRAAGVQKVEVYTDV